MCYVHSCQVRTLGSLFTTGHRLILNMRQTLAFCASERSFRDLQGLFGFSGRKAPVGSTLLNHQLSLPRSSQIDALRMSTPMPGLRLHGQMQSSGAMDSRGALRDSIPISFSDCSYAHARITSAWHCVNGPFEHVPT